MNKILAYVFCAIIILSIGASAFIFFTGTGGVQENSNITIVTTPDQTAPEWPDAIVHPLANMVALPETENLAALRPVVASSFTDIYIPSNAVDGYVTSYWESNGFPAEFTVELDGNQTFQTVALRLNPSSLWEARGQVFEVQVSTDGNHFTTIVPSDRHEFDPETGNTVRIDFDQTTAQYVRFIFTANTASRTNGAQVAEILIFE
ncbi:MAG: discoidin domain-containing protein [Defluviitaleaceae bacterium]|nr:discoidin domain-containing protein [Defluviitaleaceae bacterium]